MGDTRIEWAEKVWNPVTGCSWISPGCDNCYARRMAKRLAGRCGYPKDNPFAVTFHEDRLNDPLRWIKPKRIFVCSMGDLFHESISFDSGVYRRIFDVMSKTPQHSYMVLTKRPEKMAWALAPFLGDIVPDNLWVGVSAEDSVALRERVTWLLRIPAKVRFLSIEPMLGPVDLPEAIGMAMLDLDMLCGGDQGIHWVIVGGETGPNARLINPEWLFSVVRQSRSANVPLFVKQISGRNHTCRHYDMPEWAKIRMFPGETWPEGQGDIL